MADQLVRKGVMKVFVHFLYLFWQIQLALYLLMTYPLKTIGCSFIGQKSVIVVLDAAEDGLTHNDGSAGALDADSFIQAPHLLLKHFSTVQNLVRQSKNLTACFIQAMVVVRSRRFLKRFVLSLVRRFVVGWRLVTVNVM